MGTTADRPNLLATPAFGYDDVHHPANVVRTDRESVANAITFHS